MKDSAKYPIIRRQKQNKMQNNVSGSAVITDAIPEDAVSICEILQYYARQHLLLPRTIDDIQQKISNFAVAKTDGRFAGCCALRDYGDGLYEVRSLAVHPDFQRRGIASALVRNKIAKVSGTHSQGRIFTLTYQVEFFQKLGFSVIKKECFPQKIWTDCFICSKRDCCDEVALSFDFSKDSSR